MTEAYANISSTMKWFDDNGNKISHVPFNFIMISDLNEQSTATDFKVGIDRWYDNMPSGANANWVLGNHDRPRIAERYGADRVDGLAILSLLLPGLSFIYYVRIKKKEI
jgi:alpha-glucosidase